MTRDRPTEKGWDRLLTCLSAAWPLARWGNLGVVVGCSGGADSVALLRAMSDLVQRQAIRVARDQQIPLGSVGRSPVTGFLIAAHYNHALRGDASDQDQRFVETLAQQLGLTCVVERADTVAAVPPSDEATLRGLRRSFLLRTAQRYGARYIATAHTSDDNAETVLHHLMRGTGPAGLAGIASHTAVGVSSAPGARDAAKDFVLVRPLLAVRRSAVRQALRSIGQAWREDASNLDTEYRRNWIRHELIPLMEAKYPNAVDAIGRCTELQREWRSQIERIAGDWLDVTLLSQDPPELAIPSPAEPAVIIAGLQQLWDRRRWSRGEMSMSHWNRLAGTIRSARPERYDLPGAINVVASTNRLAMTPKAR